LSKRPKISHSKFIKSIETSVIIMAGENTVWEINLEPLKSWVLYVRALEPSKIVHFCN
jgi:hypothetical protein